MTRKITIEEIKQKFKEAGCEMLSEVYIDSQTKMNYRCSCGNVSQIRLASFNRGERCWACKGHRAAKKLNLSIEDARRVFEDNGMKLLENVYVNTKTKMRCICVCGEETYMQLNNVKKGAKCVKCGYKNRNNRKVPYEEVKQYFEDNGCELLAKDYVGMKTPLEYKCSCGNKSKIAFYNFKQGQRCRECGIKKNSGPNHPSYNPNLTQEERERGRLDKRLRKWKLDVKIRDNFTCKMCGDCRGGNLVSHHLEGYNINKELRYEISNGVTLCDKCHKKFHLLYGYGDNTRAQMEELLRLKRINPKEVLPSESA